MAPRRGSARAQAELVEVVERQAQAPKADKRKLVPWEADRVEAVRAELPARYRAMADVGAGLGLRQGEILGLPRDGGHHDPGFTLRVYRHLMVSDTERARKAVEAALRGQPEQERNSANVGQL